MKKNCLYILLGYLVQRKLYEISVLIIYWHRLHACAKNNFQDSEDEDVDEEKESSVSPAPHRKSDPSPPAHRRRSETSSPKHRRKSSSDRKSPSPVKTEEEKQAELVNVLKGY